MKPYAEGRRWKLWHGDARDVLAALPAGYAHAVISDPPYGVAGSSGTINSGRAKAVYAGEWDDNLDAVRTVFVPAICEAMNVCGSRGAVKPGTPHCFEYPKPADIASVYQPASHGMSKWGRATWQPILLYGRDPRVGRTIQPLHFTARGVFAASIHPCPTPDDIAVWMVLRASLEGEHVIDPFCGSGTIGEKALLAGRTFTGIDIEPAYLSIAARRLAQAEQDGVQTTMFGGAA